MRFTHALVFSLIATVAACDSDPPPPPPPPGDAGGMDSGPDAGDAGGIDAARIDGDVPRDSRPPSDSGGVPVCTISPSDVHKLTTGFSGTDRIVGFAAGADSFGVVWHELRGAQTDVFARRLSPADGLGAEQRLTDQFSQERTPTIVASGSNWIASWVDNEASVGFDVRTQLLNADLSVSGSVNAITTTDTLVEDNPTLINIATGPMLFFVEDDMVGGTRTGRAVLLETNGTVRGTVQAATASGTRPGQIAAGELTDGPVLLWSEGVGSVQDLLMQRLTAAGATSGSTSTISVESNADGTVDAALTVSGGAVVFGVNVGGVRNEVRFRAIDSAGVLVGDERALVTPPAIARDASIAAFAGGFAVSYRVDPGDGSPPVIRLLLVDAIGNTLAEEDVSGATDSGGRTTIRVTGTGQLGIAWADREIGGLSVTVALVRCGG